MKIERIEIYSFNVRVENDDQPAWHPVGCRVYLDDGTFGDGEIALAYGFARQAAAGALADFAPSLLGKDPRNTEVIWHDLYKKSFWAQNGGPVSFGAISAFDIALWDLRGKLADAPVYELLGGRIRDRLRCYASQIHTGWGDRHQVARSPQDFLENTRLAMAEGYDAVKLDALVYDENGHELAYDQQTGLLPPHRVRMVRDRFAAVREALGPDGDIIMECHAHTDAQATMQLVRAVEEFGIFAVEEPTTPSPAMNRKLKSELRVPLAGGERLYGRWQFLPYFVDGTIDLAQPDLGICGGISEGKKIADAAYAYDVGIQAHICASPLSVGAAVSLEAAIPNFTIHEDHVRYRWAHNQELASTTLRATGGYIEVPDEVGIGCEFTDAAIAAADVLVIDANNQ